MILPTLMLLWASANTQQPLPEWLPAFPWILQGRTAWCYKGKYGWHATWIDKARPTPDNNIIQAESTCSRHDFTGYVTWRGQIGDGNIDSCVFIKRVSKRID